MKYLLIVFFLFLSTYLPAQDSAASRQDSIPAVINGGQEAWRHFLEKNIHPEVPARNGARQGTYIVTISFLVDTTGKVSDVQIIKDAGYGTADDVLRAFKHCPLWKPATIGGRPVFYRQKQNIYYQVSEQ